MPFPSRRFRNPIGVIRPPARIKAFHSESSDSADSSDDEEEAAPLAFVPGVRIRARITTEDPLTGERLEAPEEPPAAPEEPPAAPDDHSGSEAEDDADMEAADQSAMLEEVLLSTPIGAMARARDPRLAPPLAAALHEEIDATAAYIRFFTRPTSAPGIPIGVIAEGCARFMRERRRTTNAASPGVVLAACAGLQMDASEERLFCRWATAHELPGTHVYGIHVRTDADVRTLACVDSE